MEAVFIALLVQLCVLLLLVLTLDSIFSNHAAGCHIGVPQYVFNLLVRSVVLQLSQV